MPTIASWQVLADLKVIHLAALIAETPALGRSTPLPDALPLFATGSGALALLG
jgi:hypothetical protein